MSFDFQPKHNNNNNNNNNNNSNHCTKNRRLVKMLPKSSFSEFTHSYVPYTNRSLSFISIDSTTSSSFDDHDRSGSGGVHPFHDLDIPTLLSPSYEEKEKVLFLPIDRCLDQPVISSRDKLLGSAPRKPLMRTRSSSPTDMYSKATPLDILKHKYRTQLPSKMDVDYSSFSTD